MKDGKHLVDQFYQEKKGKTNYKGTKMYEDYREMLMDKDIDAVLDFNSRPLACTTRNRGSHGRKRHLPSKTHLSNHRRGKTVGQCRSKKQRHPTGRNSAKSHASI
jgi:hypothetical protein